MRLSERRKEGTCYFAVRHTAGEVVGGEVEIAVFTAREGEGELLLRRTLYFEEQSHDHIDNFCKEFAYDLHYRKICLEGTAHWWHVARIYEANARIIQDEQTLAPDDLEERCRELFHFIRRDLALIEGRPEYQEEMARVSRAEEDDLQEALLLLAQVKNVQVTSACQGSARLQVAERDVYLPSCHVLKATITMSVFPPALKKYLQSGPLGQQHLALFEEDGLRARAACHNKMFIEELTSSLDGFLRKQAAPTCSRQL